MQLHLKFMFSESTRVRHQVNSRHGKGRSSHWVRSQTHPSARASSSSDEVTKAASEAHNSRCKAGGMTLEVLLLCIILFGIGEGKGH